jgi:hypothetical protein
VTSLASTSAHVASGTAVEGTLVSVTVAVTVDCSVGVPDDPAGNFFLVIDLHGSGQLGGIFSTQSSPKAFVPIAF